jgi:hypothetical protein
MTTTMITARSYRTGARVGIAALALVATGCDLQLLPEAAKYENTTAPRMAVVVQADAMPQGGVVAVDLELVDVLLHRESDDAWVWVAGDASRVELSLAGSETQSSVPLLADRYDRMLVVVDAPRVALDGSWQRAGLVHDEIELEIDLDLDADAEIELRFDVEASLSGESGQFQFDPRASAHIVAD